MASIPKIVSVLACGVLLGVGLLTPAVTAADWMKVEQPDEGIHSQPGLEKEAGQLKGAIVEAGGFLQGQSRESMFIEGTNFGVKGQDSKEVGLQIDGITQQRENIQKRDPRSEGEFGQSDAE
ncbi:MAG: hypothetical protein ACREJN_16705 [Nitrospiraceae bacterium]